MTLTDPTVLPRAIRLVEYLEAVRNLREQPMRDVAEPFSDISPLRMLRRRSVARLIR
jgi:hypothetical protein